MNTHAMDNNETAGEEAPELNETVRKRLGTQLAAFYGQLVTEPIPNHLLELLAKLDKQESRE